MRGPERMNARTDAERLAPLPHLTSASAPLTHAVEVVNELGERLTIQIPAERDLTVYVDKRELVTLMTLGARPEWLVLGYLLNQRLIGSASDILSITVDWDVGAASVKTREGIDRIEERTARRVVTTGCGQGSVFGGLMDDVDAIRLAPAASVRQADLYSIVNTIRLMDSTYKAAGSVHACALFQGDELQIFVEDVGRHNAVDTIAGWMAMKMDPRAWSPGGSLPPEAVDPILGRPGGGIAHAHDRALNKVFYTTGRLTSEMVIKSAQMGVAVVVSRSGMTQMGLNVAQKVGLCAIGRATNKRYLCYTHPQRLVLDNRADPDDFAMPMPQAVAVG
jgi:FdhD protein